MAQSNDAWRDALGGVVKRVPVTGEDGLVIDHVLTPIVGGRIEGGAPDKVFYYRCPDDALRGYRIHAGDLLLTIPAQTVEDGTVMVRNTRAAGSPQGHQAGGKPAAFAKLRPGI